MARGLAKQQAKAKTAKKLAKKASSTAHDHKAARAQQLKVTCTVCKSQISDLKTYKSHFEAKHPKAPMPDDLKDV